MSAAQAGAVLKLLDVSAAVDKLTDRELTDAVIAEVWALKCGFCTREDFLLSELIDRFEAWCGIVRDEETGEQKE